MYAGVMLEDGGKVWSVLNVRGLAVPEFKDRTAEAVVYEGETPGARVAALMGHGLTGVFTGRPLDDLRTRYDQLIDAATDSGDDWTLALAEHAYVIENGRVAFEGAGRDLLDDPRVREAYLGISV